MSESVGKCSNRRLDFRTEGSGLPVLDCEDKIMSKREYRGRNYRRRRRRKKLIFAICILAVLTGVAGSAAVLLPAHGKKTALAQEQDTGSGGEHDFLPEEGISGQGGRTGEGSGDEDPEMETEGSGALTEETTEPLTEPEETTGSTTEPVTEAEPDGTQDEESSSPIVSESDPVENSWFDDAVFIGDSRVEGFRNQSGLTNAQYLAGKGMNVKSVFTEDYIRQGENKVTVLEALDDMTFSKVYIKLGINELGWKYPEIFAEDYAKLIDEIRNINPEAAIYVQSIIVVSKDKSEGDDIYNNENIAEFNELLLDMAQEKDVYYLDLNEVLADEEGYLPEDASFDGVHLKPDYCKLWLEYLKTHTAGE